MEKLKILERRLNRIGISVEFASNFPWIYLYKVNGKLVKETYRAEHGFTIAFLPIRGRDGIRFTDLDVVFKIIRKYCA